MAAWWHRIAGWIPSLLFWPALFLSALLFAAVVLSPPLVEAVHLEEAHARRLAALVELDAQVSQLRRMETALLSDKAFQRRVARTQFGSVDDEGEIRIALHDDLRFDPRATVDAPAPAWTPPWYAPLALEFGRSGELRRHCVWGAIAVCLFAFVCLPVRREEAA